eukprot:m51a1_g3714 hypothetical protein (729) ;mRNA; f:452382-454568
MDRHSFAYSGSAHEGQEASVSVPLPATTGAKRLPQTPLGRAAATARRWLWDAPSASGQQQQRRRVDIQALRALSIALVVLYHYGSERFAGGFVGVDCFFVVSGYLVFGPLLRESWAPWASLASSLRSLASFAGRRVRRLSLPSAVALVAVVAALRLGPRCRSAGSEEVCRAMLEDTGQAALHAANVRFMRKATQYFNEDAPSIVLHFWSLAVEEQLYAVVPLALIAARWARPRAPALVSSLGLAAVALSFASTLFLAQPLKFFGPWSRLWEFAAGAAVYANDTWRPPKGPATAVACALAVALIAACGMSATGAGYPDATAAVVVALTSFVVACEYEYPAPLVETLGNASYSVYLYHWPAYQLAGYYALVWGFGGHCPVWLAAGAVTALYATLSYLAVERPLQLFRARWRWPVVLAVALLCTFVPYALATARLPGRVDVAAAAPQQAPEGSNSSGSGEGDDSAPWLANNNTYSPSRLALELDRAATWPWLPDDLPLWQRLERNGADSALVVLVGESHAYHWLRPLSRYCRTVGASFVSAVLSKRIGLGAANNDFLTATVPSAAPAWVRRYRHVTVVLAAVAKWETVDRTIAPVLQFWSSVGCTVVVQDTPSLGLNALLCLAKHIGDARRCSVPELRALPRKDVAEYHALRRRNATVAGNLDTVGVNDLLCWGGVCPAHANDMPVYRDSSHISTAMLDALAPHWTRRARGTTCFQRLEAFLKSAGSNSSK